MNLESPNKKRIVLVELPDRPLLIAFGSRPEFFDTSIGQFEDLLRAIRSRTAARRPDRAPTLEATSPAHSIWRTSMSRFAMLFVALLMLFVVPFAGCCGRARPLHHNRHVLSRGRDLRLRELRHLRRRLWRLRPPGRLRRPGVTTWPDREVRHVRYEGHFYNASDTSKSIVRNGHFTLTFRFDATGGLLGLTSTGLYEYVEVEGHWLPTIAGRSMTDFAFDPPISRTTPHASAADARLRLRRPSITLPAALLERGGGRPFAMSAEPGVRRCHRFD